MSDSFAVPRLMVAAPHGKSGKTVIVAGILRALNRRGITVQPFKKGPDYIDPGWHSIAARRESRNLDSFFMDGPTMNAVICDAASSAQLALIEGAMGLFDGSDLAGSSSSAEVAKQTATPVVPVIDVTRMTRTSAALVRGLMDFDPDLSVAGVIVNRVKGARHERMVRESIEHFCGIPVLGAIPEDDRLLLPDRHLGLLSSAEADWADSFIDGVADVIDERIDFDAVERIAASAPAIDRSALPRLYPTDDAQSDPVDIAVVRDRAFNFYYRENLDALTAAGARLTYVDALEDTALPDAVAGLYIGGGFPEVFAEDLQANAAFRGAVLRAVDDGMAVYAECGGLMYLARSLRTGDADYAMVGAFDLDIHMETARQGHGYSIVEANEHHPWLPAGTQLRGHEHHHSTISGIGEDARFAYGNLRGHGIVDKRDGICRNRTVAGYTHVNAIASPEWALGFVRAAREYRDGRTSGDSDA